MFLCNGCQLFEELCIEERGKHSIPGLGRDLGTGRERFQDPSWDMSIQNPSNPILLQDVPLWGAKEGGCQEKKQTLQKLHTILKSLFQDILFNISFFVP